MSKSTSPSTVVSRLQSWQYVAQVIIDGLNGKRFSWTAGEFEAYRKKAEAMGLTLVTKTTIKRWGYRLKRGAEPIGTGYFRSPISRDAELYVLECQAVKEE
jgi:hypothetical protein